MSEPARFKTWQAGEPRIPLNYWVPVGRRQPGRKPGTTLGAKQSE